MKYRKATRAEREQHARDNGLYPLHAIVTTDAGLKIEIEDLRNSWRAPDPVWEILAPRGYIFGAGMGTHSILSDSLAQAKIDAADHPLDPCDCGCADE